MNRAIALLLFSLMLASCGGHTETIQKAEKGYLKFVGNTRDITIAIDNGSAFSFNPEIELYQVGPGKHVVKVFRNNDIVVNRIIIVDDQITTEINVP